jgi:hypothetical protein
MNSLAAASESSFVACWRGRDEDRSPCWEREWEASGGETRGTEWERCSPRSPRERRLTGGDKEV